VKILVAADHAGYRLKEQILVDIQELGHDVIDLGTDSEEPVDYPDFARALGEALVAGKGDRGVLICGSGVGASIAANKVPGVRAAVCHDTYSAHQGVEHDDMNVLTLGGRVVGDELTKELVRAYLGASFSGIERHVRRLEKILAIEHDYLKS
jgi:ribose 5-phosphate isomerase B